MSKLNPRVRILVSLGFSVLALVLIMACADATETQTPADHNATAQAILTANPVRTPTPTKTPKPSPTLKPSPTPLQATNGPTVLGAPISNFFGAYGGAMVRLNSGFTWFLYDQNDNPLKWVAAYYGSDGTMNRVSVVNSTETDWSMEESIGECHAFLPDDATFEEWVDNDQERFTSSQGEIQLSHENDAGDCLVWILGS